MTMAKPKQYVFLHVLRIVAAFFVIFNHLEEDAFFLYTQCRAGSPAFWVYLLFSVFSKVSVPLFFMISGALLLNNETETLGQLWKKRVPRVAIPLVVFSLAYYFASVYAGGTPFRLGAFLTVLYSANWMYHLWYLYAYLAFLICLPFLRAMARNLSDKHFAYMIAVALFFNGILPCAEYLLGQGTASINTDLRPAWLLTSSVLYPCIGYFLQHRLSDRLSKKRILLLWAANLAGLAISCLMTYYRAKFTGNIAKDEVFHGCFVLVNAGTLFCTAKYLFAKISVTGFAEKLIRSVSECTFGIYLIHILVRDRGMLLRLFGGMRASGVNALISGLAYCTCVFLISYAITFLLSKIPLVKKIVGF